MSQIIKARNLIGKILKKGRLDKLSRKRLKRALSMMYREKATRRAPPKRIIVSRKKRAQVRRLARTTKMTTHEIANATGLRSAGRVSEVLHGKR